MSEPALCLPGVRGADSAILGLGDVQEIVGADDGTHHRTIHGRKCICGFRAPTPFNGPHTRSMPLHHVHDGVDRL